MSERYDSWIESVIALLPDADREKVGDMFERYEIEYYIPPVDAWKTIVRHLKTKWRCTNGCPNPSFTRITYESLDEHGMSEGEEYTTRIIECVCGAEAITE